MRELLPSNESIIKDLLVLTSIGFLECPKKWSEILRIWNLRYGAGNWLKTRKLEERIYEKRPSKSSKEKQNENLQKYKNIKKNEDIFDLRDFVLHSGKLFGSEENNRKIFQEFWDQIG